MPVLLAMLVALLIGAGLSTQAGINASLRAALGHPFHAAVVNFAVGGASVLLFATLAGLRMPPAAHFARSAPWMYAGGFLGAVYVVGVITLAPRLGASTLMALVVTGQLVAAAVIDHFGWLGFPLHHAGPGRLLGVVLLVVGVVLVRRG